MEYLEKFEEGATYLVEDTFKLKECVCLAEKVENGGVKYWFDVGYAKLKATSTRCKLVKHSDTTVSE